MDWANTRGKTAVVDDSVPKPYERSVFFAGCAKTKGQTMVLGDFVQSHYERMGFCWDGTKQNHWKNNGFGRLRINTS